MFQNLVIPVTLRVALPPELAETVREQGLILVTEQASMLVGRDTLYWIPRIYQKDVRPPNLKFNQRDFLRNFLVRFR